MSLIIKINISAQKNMNIAHTALYIYIIIFLKVMGPETFCFLFKSDLHLYFNYIKKKSSRTALII